MKTYHVKYTEWWDEEVKGVDVLTRNAIEAYDKATEEYILSLYFCN